MEIDSSTSAASQAMPTTGDLEMVSPGSNMLLNSSVGFGGFPAFGYPIAMGGFGRSHIVSKRGSYLEFPPRGRATSSRGAWRGRAAGR